MVPPPIRGICETALYTDDLAESRAFYAGTLNLSLMLENEKMLAFDAGTAQVLLVFKRGQCEADNHLYGGLIPGHRGDGPAHMAFHVSVTDYDRWKSYLEAIDLPLTGEVTFPPGGRSLYFNDPSGNVIELATPGHWSNF